MSCESVPEIVQLEKIEFGSWVLERILGSGAFGKVLLLKNKKTDEQIAVKKCHSHTSSSSFHFDQWRREINILHQLKHPGVINVLPVPGELETIGRDVPILCMEYCSGGDLRRVLKKPENACGLPEKDVMQIAGDISAALGYLHSVKVVHRDLKPENIVIQQNEDKNVYKLADLGFAKDLNKQSLCHTLVGTLQYVAPELFISETYTNTADYWSLGLVIHECITGVRPFLPGYPTVQWVQYVEKKSREDICVYVRPDGELVYSQTLFKENHLSSVIENLLEDWLKLMLDWDPARRGRNYIGSKRIGQIIAFENLDRIRNTCVASVFWVDELKTLSYAISDDTSIETIQDWISRDTGIKRQNQLLISPRGYPPDQLKGASQLLGGKEISITCLFSKQNDSADNRLPPSYPEFLEAMLKEPKKETEYRIQKRMWAQAIFFIQQQDFLYRRLLYSLKLLSTHMTVRSALLKQQIDYINGAIRHAESCHDLFTRSLEVDHHNFQTHSQRGGLPSSSLSEKWKQEEIFLQMTLRELETRYTILDQTIREVLRNSNTTARVAANFLSKPDTSFETLNQSATELYGDLLRRSNDRKQEVDNNLAMAKLIVRTLKARQQLFSDCFTQIRIVEKYTAEIETLSPQLLVIKTEIDQFQEQMFQLQSQRQNEVWTLLDRAVALWQRTSAMNETSQSFSCNSSDPSIITLPSLGLAPNTSQETLMVIKENQTLRYKIQDLISQRISSSCASTQSFDMNFFDME